MPLGILRVVIEMGLLDAVNETAGEPVNVAELDNKTGIDKLLIRECC